MAYQVTRGTVKTLRHAYICGAVKVAWRARTRSSGAASAGFAYTPTTTQTQLPEGISDYWANLASPADAVRRQLVLLCVLLGAVALSTLLAVLSPVERSSPPPTSPARSHPAREHLAR